MVLFPEADTKKNAGVYVWRSFLQKNMARKPTVLTVGGGQYERKTSAFRH